MGQISFPEANRLLKKLFDERVPLVAFLASSAGARSKLSGFLSGASQEEGLLLLPAGASTTDLGTYLNVRPFGCPCDFWYGGEVREMPEETREHFAETYGESVLTFVFRESNEFFALFFTL